jgi:AcrR family transcriptional regulator
MSTIPRNIEGSELARARVGDDAAKAPRRHTDGATAQEQLLDAAQELFYRDGIRAIGVDAVVERAGVNKMSLYRQFSSKDELAIAYLNRMDERFRARFEASVAKHPDAPQEQLLQAMTDLVERASAPDYRGCPFVNVASEFADPAHPARASVARNKQYLMARLVEISAAAGAAEPAELADALALVVDGVYATSQTYSPGCGPMRAAPRLAAMLIANACPRRDSQPEAAQ